MNKRTRLFLATATGILVLGLGTGLMASYLGLQNFRIIGSDGPAELAYVPSDARMVAYADVRGFMDSQLRETIRRFEPDAKSPEQLETETGINLERVVDQIVAASWAATHRPGPDRPLLIARGRFDEVRIEGAIRQHEGKVEDYRGKRLLSTPDGKIGVAFVEPGLVLVGDAMSVRRAIDTRTDGAANVKGNEELMRLIKTVEGGTGWAVARFDALTGRHVPPEIASQLPPINWFAVSGQVGSGFQGTVRAETRDEQSAQNLREVIRGFVALGRMQASQQPQVGELINSLELGGDGNVVSVSFSVPEEMITAIGQMHAERSREQQSVPAAPEL